MLDITLPKSPHELAELTARAAEIHSERQAVEAEIHQIQDATWQSQHCNNDDLDRAAERVATGETAAAASKAPERLDALRSRLDVLRRATSKVQLLIAEERARHHRAIAKALRPAHKAATQRIAAALAELVDANAAEAQIRAQAPGGTLAAMAFIHVGTFGPGGGAAAHWKTCVRQHGYLAESAQAAGEEE